jgi:hypothetical protein
METDVELKVGRCWSHSSAGSTDHFGMHAHVRNLVLQKIDFPISIFQKMQSSTTDPPWHIRRPQGGPLYGPHRSHNISEGDEIYYFAKGGAQGGWSLVCVGEWDEDIK